MKCSQLQTETKSHKYRQIILPLIIYNYKGQEDNPQLKLHIDMNK